MNISMQVHRSLAAIALSIAVGAFAIARTDADTDTVSLSLPIYSAMSVTPMCVADATVAPGRRACYEASVVVGQPLASAADTSTQAAGQQ